MPRRGTCRVCFEEDSEVIAPCKCKGTAKWVHRDCLNKWRASGSNPKAVSHCCECDFEYRLVMREGVNGPHSGEPSAMTVSVAVGFAALAVAFLIFSTVAVIVGSALFFANLDVEAVTALVRAGHGADAAAKDGQPSSVEVAPVHLYWMWSIYFAGVSAVGTLLGIAFGVGFLTTFPGKCYEETRVFLQSLWHGHNPSLAEWWNVIGSMCVIYWIMKGLWYACTAPKQQVLPDLDSFLAFWGLVFGALSLVIPTTFLMIYAYREWDKVTKARCLTSTYDVEDLAEPEDMGDIEDQTAPPAPAASPRPQPELQKALSDGVAKIYRHGDTAGGVAAPAAEEGGRGVVDRARLGLQRNVSNIAAGILHTAPPQRPTTPPSYGTPGSSSAQ